MNKGTALEGFSALFDGTGNADTVLPVTVQTKVTLEYDLVRRCHQAGAGPLRDRALGTVPDLWPWDMLRRPLLDHAHEFTRQVAGHGYEALDNVHSFKVWGPYMEKVGEVEEWTPEEGNHVIPEHLQRKAHRTWGYMGNELRWDKGCSFIIVGRFQRAAKHGHVDEQLGVILV